MRDYEPKTSDSHPIEVDFIPQEAIALPGCLGMTLLPGVHDYSGDGRGWERDLKKDLGVLREEYQTKVLVSLMEECEYYRFDVPELFEEDRIEDIEILKFAIRDVDIPQEAEAEEFENLIWRIIDHLKPGDNVVIHCRGGLGRTGMVAACVVVALGKHCADEAMDDVVRKTRKGTIQTVAQEEYVRRFEAELKRAGRI